MTASQWITTRRRWCKPDKLEEIDGWVDLKGEVVASRRLIVRVASLVMSSRKVSCPSMVLLTDGLVVGLRWDAVC